MKKFLIVIVTIELLLGVAFGVWYLSKSSNQIVTEDGKCVYTRSAGKLCDV